MVERTCEQCGNPLTTRTQKRFCSPACHGKWMSDNLVGEKNSCWRGGKVTQTCLQCGQIFEVYPGAAKKKTRKYCSRTCQGLWTSKNLVGERARSWKGGKVSLICKECGKLFDVWPYRIKEGKELCCSDMCARKWRGKQRRGEAHPGWKGGKIAQPCAQCGETIEVWPYEIEAGTRKFCNHPCYANWLSEHQIGGNHPMWRGGSFEPYSSEFNSILKKAIRERDGHTCAICGKWGNEVHHINYDKKDSNPANLITLCKKDHCRTTTGDRDYWQRHFVSKWLLVENWWEASPANLGVG